MAVRTKVRVGILGGAFDPPHLGHVALARAAVEQLGLEELRVLVVADPGHKRTQAAAEARLELAGLAFEDIPNTTVELDHHARTVDSLEERGADDAVFVLGADELAGFTGWKDPERVLELVRIAVAMRPGTSIEQLRSSLGLTSDPDRIVMFEMPPTPISSTDVRARIARGESIERLVPERVARAIARLGLYAGPE